MGLDLKKRTGRLLFFLLFLVLVTQDVFGYKVLSVGDVVIIKSTGKKIVMKERHVVYSSAEEKKMLEEIKNASLNEKLIHLYEEKIKNLKEQVVEHKERARMWKETAEKAYDKIDKLIDKMIKSNGWKKSNRFLSGLRDIGLLYVGTKF